MVATRVEKLKFIVEEMHIAFHLATHAPDAFVARTLARHILIRAENFIEHARGLRKPLNIAGYDTHNFHKTKEAYAVNFDEYFQVSRDRLGAHVQDFDFGKRIELWNDIEIVKISFFIDGAKEIYQCLSIMNLPGYAPYADPPELTDASLNEVLREFQRSKDNRQWVEFGVDPLAMTRENTTATFNMTPVHSRAGQLALIRRWIKMQSCLLDKLVSHSSLVRVLKARIVTDIVSFCDCLVTRPIPVGEPQEMDGLDKLISANGQSPSPIGDFVAASNFHAELLVARTIRDKIGAHLEIDAARTLSSLVADLDDYDIEKGRAFYGLVESVFVKVCRNILYLRLYAADGQRAYGITAGTMASVPFSGNATGVQMAPPPPPLPINEEDAYRQNLTRWLDGDEIQKGDARYFFWNAFMASEIVGQIDEKETFCSGSRISMHEFRKAHLFIASTLTIDLSDSDFGGVLELILSCSNGWPYPLAELLVRYGPNASELRQWQICYALGEIASCPHASVSEFLEALTKSVKWGLRLQATLAIFQTFVKSEGLYRLNHKNQTKADYSAFVGSLTASMAAPELLLCSLAFASILSGPGIGSFSQPFADDYGVLQAQIETLCVPYLMDDMGLAKATTLKQLIQTNDYVGICVLLAIDIQDDARKQLRDALIDDCCNGSIVTAAHDQASRHLAMCFLLKKEYGRALKIAEAIAARNPDWINPHILVAQILADSPGSEVEATRKIADLRRSYKLDANNEAVLASAEQEITQRKASQAVLVQ
jgi:hypothetical protein